MSDSEVYLPPFLTVESRRALLRSLEGFRSQQAGSADVERQYTPNYYSDISLEAEWAQGDVWEGFQVVRFDDGRRKDVNGLILSNTCDVNPANDIPESRPILFCPTLSVDKIEQMQRSAGMQQGQIDSFVANIRKQLVTYMFWLPAVGHYPERVVLLDDVHRYPWKTFEGQSRKRQVRLSDFGHWLLLIKISIHFCRLNEGEPRDELDI